MRRNIEDTHNYKGDVYRVHKSVNKRESDQANEPADFYFCSLICVHFNFNSSF